MSKRFDVVILGAGNAGMGWPGETVVDQSDIVVLGDYVIARSGRAQLISVGG